MPGSWTSQRRLEVKRTEKRAKERFEKGTALLGALLRKGFLPLIIIAEDPAETILGTFSLDESLPKEKILDFLRRVVEQGPIN